MDNFFLMEGLTCMVDYVWFIIFIKINNVGIFYFIMVYMDLKCMNYFKNRGGDTNIKSSHLVYIS